MIRRLLSAALELAVAAALVPRRDIIPDFRFWLPDTSRPMEIHILEPGPQTWPLWMHKIPAGACTPAVPHQRYPCPLCPVRPERN